MIFEGLYGRLHDLDQMRLALRCIPSTIMVQVFALDRSRDPILEGQMLGHVIHYNYHTSRSLLAVDLKKKYMSLGNMPKV